MDRSKFDFTFENWLDSSVDSPGKGMWLWIFHVDKIPPHIGLSQDKMFFSLKSNGRDEISVNKLIQTVVNKNIKCICLNLNYTISEAAVRMVFSHYERAVSSKLSCLSPIREILNVSNEIKKLSELLHVLSDLDLLDGMRSYNVSKDEMGILKYDVSDIDKRLNLLHA